MSAGELSRTNAAAIPSAAARASVGWRLGIICVCLLFASSEIRGQPLSFRPPTRLPVGTFPQTVLIVDVNKDGKNDLLVANGSSSNLTVYLGDGKGGFTQSKGSPFPAGPSPNDLAVGDFNGDGNLDVAIANHSVKLLTVLLGDGKGGFSFAPGSPFTAPSNPHPHGIAAADFNGDGTLDLVVDSWAENKVLVLFGKGDGTFAVPGVKYAIGEMPYERVRAADLNDDGFPDIITSNHKGNSVSVLFGNGRGGFSLARGKNIAVPPSPFGLAIADFNGDHHPDIAVIHYSGQASDPSQNGLSILFGDGHGNFSLAQGSPLAVGHYPATVAAGDVNGDGIADVVVPNHLDNTIMIYLGGRTGMRHAEGSPVRVGHGPECVAIGDLNGDGKADLAITDGDDNDLMILFAK